jgi:hypothetical protein
MKLNLILIVALYSMALSCSSDVEDKEQILNQDKMANVLYDVLLAESYVESYLFKDTVLNKDSLLKIEMDKVLKVYGISSSSFSKSYLYYKAHPLQLETVLDSAHERAVRGRSDVFIRRRITKNR